MSTRALLFVCMGNICRSPTAEGVFRKLAADRGVAHRFEVDSAGTHDYHVGAAPDSRAIAAARRRGVDLSALCARQVTKQDFTRFDLVLVMDDHNYERLASECPPPHRGKIRLFMEYAPQTGRRAVPDPYYGGVNAFEEVLDLVEQAAEGLLDELLKD
ncbi:MAG: low molecular weight protein-tyrosine-phosphatase [Gammaproteobacteria bacterium]